MLDWKSIAYVKCIRQKKSNWPSLITVKGETRSRSNSTHCQYLELEQGHFQLLWFYLCRQSVNTLVVSTLRRIQKNLIRKWDCFLVLSLVQSESKSSDNPLLPALDATDLFYKPLFCAQLYVKVVPFNPSRSSFPSRLQRQEAYPSQYPILVSFYTISLSILFPFHV